MKISRKRPLDERIHNFLDRNMLPFSIGFLCGVAAIIARIME